LITDDPQNTELLALSIGDPDGIGPEIALKAWQNLKSVSVRFALWCDPNLVTDAAAKLALPEPIVVTQPKEAISRFPDGLPIFALPESSSRPQSAIDSIIAVTEAVQSGIASAIITCPISKARLWEVGFAFPGHTEFIAELTQEVSFDGERGPVMMLSGGGLRTCLVSVHTSLKSAIDGLSKETIIHVARVSAEALRRDFALDTPRLAIAGLNPHAGENGAMGHEDQDIIAPAVEALQASGIDAFGPLPPDTMFHAEARANYDAAICMYHDQGLIPVKTLDFHGGVNITLGLPVIRTSPDHGTAFDIAGKGIARPDSLIAALKTASELAANRKARS
jgi:4-hydroxythreonine-4-phosphate dehydrogenase